MAITLVMSCASVARISMKPSPPVEAKSSAISAPNKVVAKPTRRPATISGNAAGTRMYRIIRQRDSRMTAAVSR